MNMCKWIEITNTDTGIRKFKTSCGRFYQFLGMMHDVYCPYCGKEIEVKE